MKQTKQSGYAILDLENNSAPDIKYMDDVYVGTPVLSRNTGKVVVVKDGLP